MPQRPATLQERQDQIDTHFGKGEYKLLRYTGVREPASIKHLKCGKIINKDYKYFNFAVIKNHSICPCTFKKTGPKATTIEQRQSELDKLFDTSYKILHYEHTDKPITVEHSCGYKFNTDFHALRKGDSSCRCLKTTKNPYLGLDKHQTEIDKRYGSSYKVLEYNWEPDGTEALNAYVHEDCGYIWVSSRTSALSKTKVCPQCCGPCGSNLTRLTKEQIEIFINTNSIRQYTVVSYTKKNSPTSVKCKQCGDKQVVIPNNRYSLYKGFPCKGCGDALTRITFKKNGKKFTLRGFEPQALDYLVDELGYNVWDVKYKRCNIPRFDYKFAKKRHSYYPDFFHKPTNTIIEVKSTFTLGLHNDKGHFCNPKTYLRNKAKARAVRAKGYNFMLIVICGKTGKPIKLPNFWYNFSRKELLAYI